MKKRIICLLTCAALAVMTSGCTQTAESDTEQIEITESTESVTEAVSETETEADTEEVDPADYAGVWYLDQEVTGEHLSTHKSLEEMFGSSLAETGAELTLTEDGSISYYIGETFYAEGTCSITDGWILAELKVEQKSNQTEDLNQILQPMELSDTAYIAMVLEDETLYWSMTAPETTASVEDEKKNFTQEEMEALADVTKEVIDDYGYENDFSELSFELDGDTLKDCGDYYLICVTLEKPVTVTGDLNVGDTLTFTVNDLTGETETVVYESEGILVNEETGIEYGYWPDNDEVILYTDSDDRLDSPFYEGAIRINKDAVTGIEITEEYETVTPETLEQESSWYNAVSFDENGNVTKLSYSGD